MESRCVICGEIGGKLTKVKEKGKSTLVTSSKQRNDDKWILWVDLNNLDVHEKCRKKYTHPSEIAKLAKTVENTAGTSTILRSRASELFDFKTHCLFCSEPTKLAKKFGSVKSFRQVSTIHFKNTVSDQAKKRGDNWGQEVFQRICIEIDLVAAEARYHVCCYKKFMNQESTKKPGRPVDNILDQAFEEVCKEIENDSENCQFSFDELIKKMQLPENVEPWSEKYTKSKLKKKYGENIVISETPGKRTVFCFRGTCEKLLTDEWYQEKKNNVKDERLRIVEAAAKILKEDIRSMVCNVNEYPSLEEIQLGGVSGVPESLDVFFKELILSNKRHSLKLYLTKIKAIQNFIISLVRVRSYLSPIMFGIGVHLHRKYGSKFLIDLLSSLGVSVTYSECIQFENSAVANYKEIITENNLVQFVFDNADFNIRTLDGHNTFHSMGGIMCVSPKTEICEQKFPKTRTRRATTDIGKFGFIPIKNYKKPSKTGLCKVVMQEIEGHVDLPEKTAAFTLDMLWLSGSIFSFKSRSSWNGYMFSIYADNRSTDSEVLPLPFINLDPNNLSTIYTALTFAAEKCLKCSKSCIVTFDQPLFLKAVDIVEASNSSHLLSSIIVRLGGFHTLMSFMGSIGYLMSGSGLEELWETIYAKNTVQSMISGHAYSRALRAHLLTQEALTNVMINNLQWSNSLIEKLENLYEHPFIEIEEKDDLLRQITQIIQDRCNACLEISRTAKLWIKYWQQVQLIKFFVRAERSGTWALHIECIKEMIPLFYASGHNNYAKSAHLYLQQMNKLQNIDRTEYDKFMQQGMFTIRRTDRFWSGTWTDMVIEQSLMRAIKTQGGLTQGRGLSNTSVARWTASMGSCSMISIMLEEFVGLKSITSEQHVELRSSRKQRDQKDVKKITEWLLEHNPFKTSEFISLGNNIVAKPNVNCDSAEEIGEKILKKNVGKKFTDIKCQRSNKVITLAHDTNSIKINNVAVVINPMQLFNRILCSNKSLQEIKKCFEYELAPYPLSLFKDGTLRKGTKSQLLKEFDAKENPHHLVENTEFVIDGGYLLHKVVWQKPATYEEIFQQYVNYIKHLYGTNCVIVFDGYNENVLSTKEELQRIRSQKSKEVMVTPAAPATLTQSDFLKNFNNKKRFIDFLTKYLNEAGINVQQADRDADFLIVSAAIELSLNNQQNVTVVAEDTDIMVLLVHHVKNENVYMLRPGKAGKGDKVTRISNLQQKLGHLKECVLFLHAASGCDTTSQFFNKSKKTCFSVLQKKPQLCQALSVFLEEGSLKNDVLKEGLKFILQLYGARNTFNLSELRYILFNRITSRQGIGASFNLGSLPPTEKAAEQHLYRVYYQVQEWLGRKLNPVDWGWKKNSSGNLIPLQTTQEPAPEDILKLIFCNCKISLCGRNCSCLKLGLRCSAKCGQCNGIACKNACEKTVPSEEEDFY